MDVRKIVEQIHADRVLEDVGVARLADTVERLQHEANAPDATDAQTERAVTAQAEVLAALAARPAADLVEAGHKARALECACRMPHGSASYDTDKGLAASLVADVLRLSIDATQFAA